MKLALVATFLFSTMAKFAFGQELKDEFFAVTIAPKCDGINMGTLSGPEHNFVAEVLETTYNQVQAIFSSDMYLFGIEGSQARNLAEAGDRSLWWYSGGGACGGFCAIPNDCIDDASGYAADDPSQLCSNNDRLLLVNKTTKTHADRMWEKRVTTKLKEGPYPVFHGIGKCEISMTSTKATDEPNAVVGEKSDEPDSLDDEDVGENKKIGGGLRGNN